MKTPRAPALAAAVALALLAAGVEASVVLCNPPEDRSTSFTCVRSSARLARNGFRAECTLADGCLCDPTANLTAPGTTCHGCRGDCYGHGECTTPSEGVCACDPGFQLDVGSCRRPDSAYVGCWPEASVSAGEALYLGNSYPASFSYALGVDNCAEYCSARGFFYAGLSEKSSPTFAMEGGLGSCVCASAYASRLDLADTRDDTRCLGDAADAPDKVGDSGFLALWRTGEPPEGGGCPGDCSGHGRCVAGVCECDAGSAGDACDGYECAGTCGAADGLGSCNATTGACSCPDGLKGDECELLVCPGEPDECLGRGECDGATGECACSLPGLETPDCSGCPFNCSGVGACDEDTGTCACPAGRGGLGCSAVPASMTCFNAFDTRSNRRVMPDWRLAYHQPVVGEPGFSLSSAESTMPNGWAACRQACREAGYPAAAIRSTVRTGPEAACFCGVDPSDEANAAAIASPAEPTGAECADALCDGNIPCPSDSRFLVGAVVGPGCEVDTCGECSALPFCGWCASESRCVLAADADEPSRGAVNGNCSAAPPGAEPPLAADWRQATCCAAGTAGLECAPCGAGTYAGPGAAACSSCEAGRASAGLEAVSEAACGLCEAGRFTNGAEAGECLACAAGRFNNETGGASADACEVCAAGSYSEGAAQTTCELCAAGRYMECELALGATDAGACVACPPGRRRAGTAGVGVDACDACGEGEIAVAPASTECAPCPAGQVPDAGSVTCVKCGNGRQYSPDGGEGGASACLDCEAGRFRRGEDEEPACGECPAGRFAPANGTRDCTACPAGRHAPAPGATACEACGEGLFRPEDAGDLVPCRPCEAGHFSASPTAAACAACPPGRHANATGATGCVECLVNEYAEGASSRCLPCELGLKSFPGASACQACPAGSVFDEDEAGRLLLAEGARASVADACAVCPPGAVSVDGTECACRASFLQRRTGGSPASLACEPCPDGGDCSRQGTTLERLRPLPGFWRGSNRSTSFYRCPLDSCGEVDALGVALETCADGYDPSSVLCAVCDENHYLDSSRACVECPQGSAAMTYALAVAAVLVVFGTSAWYIGRAPREGDGAGSDVELDDEDAGDEAAEAGAGEGGAGGKGEAGGGEAGGGGGDDAGSSLRVVKIVLGHFQVLSMIESGLTDVEWPASFQRLLTFAAFPNLDVLSIVPVQCVWDADFFSEVLFMMMLMPMLGALVAAAAVLASLVARARGRGGGGGRPAVTWSLLRDRTVYVMCFLVFVTYPAVLVKLFQIFRCDDVDGTRYLVADFSIKCEGERYDGWAYAGGVFLLAYGGAIPLALFGYLFVRRSRLDSPRLLRRVGFLYRDFTPGNRAFGVLELAYKIGMAASLVFLLSGSSSQVVVCMLIAELYMFCMLYRQPYTGRDLFFGGLSLLVIFLTLLAALMLKLDVTSEDGYSRDAFGYALLAINLAVLAVIPVLLFGAVRDAGSKIRRRVARRRAARAASSSAASLEMAETGADTAAAPAAAASDDDEDADGGSGVEVEVEVEPRA